jgi:serpin B
LLQLENKLRTIANGLQQLWNEAKETKKVIVFIPKFKLEKTIPLTATMNDLGMTQMFNKYTADLSRIEPITPRTRLYVSDVIQKAFIEVNEEGSGGNYRLHIRGPLLWVRFLGPFFRY